MTNDPITSSSVALLFDLSLACCQAALLCCLSLLELDPNACERLDYFTGLWTHQSSQPVSSSVPPLLLPLCWLCQTVCVCVRASNNNGT